MRKIAKYILLVVVSYVIMCLATPYSSLLKNRAIENQIAYLDQGLARGLDVDLQTRFPEGFVFANALFGLSVLEHCSKADFDVKYAKQVDRCVSRLLSNQATRSFSTDLEIPYGAFYSGWTNLLLYEYRESALFEFSQIQETIELANDGLSQRFIEIQGDSVHLLDTYFESVWPGDNMACIASLGKDEKELQSEWYQCLKKNSTSDTLLLDHYISAESVTRGSSQALCQYFFSKFDEDAARKANSRYKSLFINKVLGVEFVKEHLGNGQMDIDSGPILFGYGAVATIMNTKAQASLDQGNYKWTWSWLNLGGMPVNLLGSKYYLGKKEPMFDLFMLWSLVEM